MKKKPAATRTKDAKKIKEADLTPEKLEKAARHAEFKLKHRQGRTEVFTEWK